MLFFMKSHFNFEQFNKLENEQKIPIFWQLAKHKSKRILMMSFQL